MRNIVCDVDKAFSFNERLYVDHKRNVKLSAILERNGSTLEEFVRILYYSCVLSFPTEDKKDVDEQITTYKTWFGPVFYSGAVCYGGGNIQTLGKGLTRILGRREPKDVGLDQMLRQNQEVAFDIDGDGSWYDMLRNYMWFLRSAIFIALHAQCNEINDDICDDAHKVHSKRALRVSSFGRLVEDGSLLMYNMYCKKVTGKIKCPEWAKPGKVSRIIGDYTCEGSLLGGFIACVMKHCFEPWYINSKFRMRFVFSPDYTTMTEIFSRLLEDGYDTFVYHSDDVCAAIVCNDGMFRCNLDISSCDTSNTIHVFNLVLWLVENTYWHTLMKFVVSQCCKEFHVVNPNNLKEKIVFSNDGDPIEYSGTVLTTLLNNIASSLICLSIWWHKGIKGVSCAEAPELVRKAAAYVGYIVTCETVEHVEDYQFLKCSPTLTDSGITVFLNLGVVLRSLGTCDGDLPGSSSITSRAEKRNMEVVRGYKHAGSHVVMDALRERFTRVDNCFSNCDKESFHLHYIVEHMTGFEESRVHVDALLRRYQICESELIELCDYIRHSHVGDVIWCSSLRAIFKKDYSL